MWYRAKVLEILSQTLFVADSAAELFCHRHQRQNRERVDRVCYLIERDLENPPSLEMLAQEVSCSPFHLSRRFRARYGLPPYMYLELVRVNRAREMLRRGEPISRVAFDTGFSDQSHLNRHFKRLFGFTPAKFQVGGGAAAGVRKPGDAR